MTPEEQIHQMSERLNTTEKLVDELKKTLTASEGAKDKLVAQGKAYAAVFVAVFGITVVGIFKNAREQANNAAGTVYSNYVQTAFAMMQTDMTNQIRSLLSAIDEQRGNAGKQSQEIIGSMRLNGAKASNELQQIEKVSRAAQARLQDAENSLKDAQQSVEAVKAKLRTEASEELTRLEKKLDRETASLRLRVDNIPDETDKRIQAARLLRSITAQEKAVEFGQVTEEEQRKEVTFDSDVDFVFIKDIPNDVNRLKSINLEKRNSRTFEIILHREMNGPGLWGPYVRVIGISLNR